jgi:hypothetical protein
MYAYELKKVGKIEQTPTHMHYLGERRSTCTPIAVRLPTG